MFNGESDRGECGAPEWSEGTDGLSNQAIATGLEEIAALLEGGSAGARRKEVLRAAALVAACPSSLSQRIAERGVEAVHELSIGYELSGVVTDWVRSGRLRWLEQLRARRRAALTQLPGIGPRLAKELHDVLGIDDVDALSRAAQEGRLNRLFGFGPKRLELLKRALSAVEEQPRQLSLSWANAH